MVDVLPAVPVTAASLRPRVSAASAVRPVLDGRPRSRAAASSGLVSRIALDTTTVAGGSGRCAASCPTWTSRAERPQREHRGRLPGVGPGHPLAAGEQDAGDPAHPGTADADEVDGHAASPPVCLRRAAHVEDEAGQAYGGVGVPGPAGRRAHRREPRRVGEQRDELGEHPVAGELGVGHQHAPARGDDRRGVEGLLAVAVRQRDVDGGQADGRHLRDGHRPAPAEHGVGGGVGQVHRRRCRAVPT